MLVDDNEEIRSALKEILKIEGYEVRSAANGIEALRLTKKSPPDMIISDVLMPEMDGFKLCHELKESKKFRRIPFIFYTANYTDKKDEDLAMAMGASCFIRKPMMPDKFLDTIKGVIREHKEDELHVPRMPLEEDVELYKMYIERLSQMLDLKIKDLAKERQDLVGAQKALQHSEDRYKILLDTIPHGIQENDLSGVITYGNKAYHVMLDAKENELIGKHIWDVVSQHSERESLKQYLANLVENQPPPSPYHVEDITMEGKKIDVKIDWNYKRDTEGSLTGFIAVITDITNQKKIEQKLKEKVDDLERFYEMAVGRELRMKELKEEIQRLKS